jgi:hypothetical protein
MENLLILGIGKFQKLKPIVSRAKSFFKPIVMGPKHVEPL